MTLSRRALLRTGTASIVVVGGAAGWFSTRVSQSAREPWQQAAEGFGDPRLDALAFAILAPNPHNMQPWQIVLTGDDSFTLYARSDRLLPETDPPARQITIGLGCFLELLRQAAAERGYRAAVDLFPEGEPQPTLDSRPIAHIRLEPDAAVDREPLFAYTLTRHTQRAPFDTDKDVPVQSLEDIHAAATATVSVGFNSEAAQRSALRDLTREAWITEWHNAATRSETVQVTRIGKAEVSEKPWGITLDGVLMSTLGSLGIVSRQSIDTPGKTSFEESLRMYNQACDTAMAHVWMSTSTNTRRDQLNAGASWVRMHQAAARGGLAFHPLSQALQEFPAMADHYAAAHALLAPPGHTLQLLARLGYSSNPGPSPREPLTAKLLAV